MDYYKNVDKLGCATKDTLFAKCVQYTVIEDLANEPVDVDFFKQHARIDFDTDDSLVTAYLKAARQELERWSQLSFGVKTIGLTALSLPKNYRLMFGKVDTVLTNGFTNKGDILKEGGTDIDIEFTTLDWIDEVIKIAICRYAAGLYLYRESKDGQSSIDEAKVMLNPYRNITML